MFTLKVKKKNRPTFKPSGKHISASVLVYEGCHNRIMEIYFLRVRRLQSKAMVLVGLLPGETSLLGLQTSVVSLCPLSGLFFCAYTLLVSFFYRDTGPIRLGPHSYDLI